jgi:hypothetical protein
MVASAVQPTPRPMEGGGFVKKSRFLGSRGPRGRAPPPPADNLSLLVRAFIEAAAETAV